MEALKLGLSCFASQGHLRSCDMVRFGTCGFALYSKTSCRRAAATICPRPSLPPVGTEALRAAEQTAT